MRLKAGLHALRSRSKRDNTERVGDSLRYIKGVQRVKPVSVFSRTSVQESPTPGVTAA